MWYGLTWLGREYLAIDAVVRGEGEQMMSGGYRE